MTKIMLVEDDKSLREIYSIRLVAEGYDIVSAGDGEEALAMAVREKPDLILSDVMMPKISGFDMLDILRSTEETKNIKIIMMTALSSEEQRQRGESLGADKYLVKSQVGIEDVISSIHEVLGDRPMVSNPAANLNVAAAVTPARAQASSPVPTVAPAPVAAPAVVPIPVANNIASPPIATPTAPVAPVAPQQMPQAQYAQQQPAQLVAQAQPVQAAQLAQAPQAQPVAQQAQSAVQARPIQVQSQQVAQPQQQVAQAPQAQPVAQAQPVQAAQLAQALPAQNRASQKIIQPLEKPAENAGQMSMAQRIAQELGETTAGGTAQ